MAKSLKRVVYDSGDDEIGTPVIVEIAEIHTHAGDRDTVFAQGHAGFESRFFERSVTPIVKQKAAYRIVRYEDVGKSVAIEIGEGHAHAFADVPTNPGGLGNVRKRAVAIVVKELTGEALINVRMTVEGLRGGSAMRLMGRVPNHVVRNEKVEPAIVVVIEPAGGNGPHLPRPRTCQSRLSSDVHEVAIAKVAVERVAVDPGNEDVGEAVVIEIGGSHRIGITLASH